MIYQSFDVQLVIRIPCFTYSSSSLPKSFAITAHAHLYIAHANVAGAHLPPQSCKGGWPPWHCDLFAFCCHGSQKSEGMISLRGEAGVARMLAQLILFVRRRQTGVTPEHFYQVRSRGSIPRLLFLFSDRATSFRRQHLQRWDSS